MQRRAVYSYTPAFFLFEDIRNGQQSGSAKRIGFYCFPPQKKTSLPRGVHSPPQQKRCPHTHLVRDGHDVEQVVVLGLTTDYRERLVDPGQREKKQEKKGK